MINTITVKPWRLLLSACVVAAVFTVVVVGIGLIVTSTAVRLLLPFVAAGLSVAGLAAAQPWIDRAAPPPSTTPTAAPTPDTPGVRADSLGHSSLGYSLGHALTGLAQILAEGTRAECAVVWLAVAEKLVSAASYPARDDSLPRTTANLAALLATKDVDHAEPVLDGSVLRGALTISKPGRPVTPIDQRLMQDIAQGARLLLHGAQLTTELEDQVRQADELAAQLQASRQRLTSARDVERHRLASELTQVTAVRLATLRSNVAEIQELLSSEGEVSELTRHALAKARTGLEELIDRFRVIARGVYPTVLRGQGPAGALEELATDLPRPVRISGRLSRRLSWEVESGIYWLAASAMQQLAGRGAEAPLRVHLEHTKGRLAVRIEDPVVAKAAKDVLAALTDDVDRLAALGGDVEIISDGAGGIALRAWLPDQLEPLVDAS